MILVYTKSWFDLSGWDEQLRLKCLVSGILKFSNLLDIFQRISFQVPQEPNMERNGEEIMFNNLENCSMSDDKSSIFYDFSIYLKNKKNFQSLPSQVVK